MSGFVTRKSRLARAGGSGVGRARLPLPIFNALPVVLDLHTVEGLIELWSLRSHGQIFLEFECERAERTSQRQMVWASGRHAAPGRNVPGRECLLEESPG